MQFILYGLLGAAILVVAAFIRRDRDKFPAVMFATCYAAFPLVLLPIQFLTMKLHPHTIDLTLYRADLALKLDPLAFARFFYSNHWDVALLAGYNALPVAAAIFYAIERPRLLVPAAILSAACAFVVYNLCPAVGPAHVFAGFPFGPYSLKPPEWVPRNCMPSMHLTWAMLLPLNAESRALKMIGWFYAAFIAVATVGIGEHYFVDLIAAVPFCLLVQHEVHVFAHNRFRGHLREAA
jgi:hypothetical protein